MANRKGGAANAQKNAMRDAFSLRVTGLLVLVILVLLAAAAAAYFFKQNEERQIKLAQQQELEEQLALLQDEAKGLDTLIAMADQPQYIERIARDELGMVQADEKVFKDVR